MVYGARLKSFSQMRSLVHNFVRGFESYSCHIFEKFPKKLNVWHSIGQKHIVQGKTAKSVKGSRFKTL